MVKKVMDESTIFRKLEAALMKREEPYLARPLPPVATLPLPRRNVAQPAYAPPVSNDPAKLANMTVQSVGRIGDASAEEIEKVREQLRLGYEEIDKKLQQLAEAFRGHARIAQDHVSGFCLQATKFFDTISAANRELQGRSEAQAEPEQDDAPPEFLTKPQE